MDKLAAYLDTINGWVWGWPLIILLFGTHLFLTVRTGFIQRYIGRMIKLSVAKDEGGEGDVSHFGALTTALAATIGTGNIFGVAGAVAIGGPGAVLWMWLTGVFGIATKYAEAVLAVKYRVKREDGLMGGGPMYVLERGMNCKWLGVVFAAFTALAAFGIGNMIQSNTLTGMVERISASAEGVPTIPSWVVGLVLTVLTGAVILGGVKSIAKVCSFLVPIMAVGYVVGCIVLLCMRISVIPETIATIFSSAFAGHAAVGGFAGAAIKQVIQMGIARGLFSNESGLGSAPIVAAAARTANPVRQALVSASATFWDTVVICAITGLVIVSSGEWMHVSGKQALAEAAFRDLPGGGFILTFGLATFVFSTILGWSYYGERAAEYLCGKWIILPYRILWVIAVMLPTLDASGTVALVWNLGDILNGLMAIPNLVSLLVLSGVIAAETRRYRGELTGHPADSHE